MRDVLVKKLQKANEAEIELAQMAQQRIDNPEIAQYIQTVIKDHQALNQQLNQATGQQAGQPRRQPGATDAASPRRGQALDPNAQANQQRGQAGQTDDRNQATQAQQRNLQGRRQPGGQEHMVPFELVSIMDKACANNLEMTKQMLSKHQGQDFQMAFLGQQTVAHTAQLAELKAIASEGPEELRPIVEQATAKVQHHLEQAQQLAAKFEDKEASDTATSGQLRR